MNNIKTFEQYSSTTRPIDKPFMDMLKKVNSKSEPFELTDKEKRNVLIGRGLCPVCESKLEENSYGEDDQVYLECSKDDSHYSKYLGMMDDMED